MINDFRPDGTMQLGTVPTGNWLGAGSPGLPPAPAVPQQSPLLQALQNFSWAPQRAQSYQPRTPESWQAPTYQQVPGGSVSTASGITSLYAPQYQQRTSESWAPPQYYPVQGGSIAR